MGPRLLEAADRGYISWSRHVYGNIQLIILQSTQRLLIVFNKCIVFNDDILSCIVVYYKNNDYK